MGYTKNVHVLLPVRDYERLKRISYENKSSISQLVRQAVEKILRRYSNELDKRRD